MAPPRPGGFGQYQCVVSSLINSATAIYNGKKSREQQERLAVENRQLTERMEANRQSFQLEVNERNAQMQKQLSLQNHQLRLDEQRNNFEYMCQQAEWNRFLNTWPLINLPSVIRQEQILSDNTVALRVIFSKSNDAIFSKAVYPRVEQGLREFIELYHNQFRSKNIIFYHNAFSGTLSGGAVETNIHYALKELPVIIIDSTVLLDEICVYFTMWGLGSSDQNHFTVFRIPYQQRTVNGNIVVEYYQAIANKILAYLKFVLGYAYDAYNLIQYDRPPLLPKVAAYEQELQVRGAMLAEAEVRAALSERYGEIYDSVIGTSETAFAQLPESYKKTILHQLRLEYAESVKDCVAPEQYIKYLDESLDAWVGLRSSLSTEEFLKEIISGELPIHKYFSDDDKTYFGKLKALYNGSGAYFYSFVLQICSKLDSVDLSSVPPAIIEKPTLPQRNTVNSQKNRRRISI